MLMTDDRTRDWRSFWNDDRLSRSLGSIPSWAAASWPLRDKYGLWTKSHHNDQARFQQRQLVEKEQKLLKIYEANQARVLGRLGTQTTVAPAGKVRQMFEERRTKAGIDKSYPLQPLAGASTRTALANLNNRNISKEKTVSHNATEIRHSTNFNGNSVNVYKSHKVETSVNKDFNLNEDSLEDIAFPSSHDYEQTVDEPTSNKIHNISNKSFTQKPIKQTSNNLKNGIVSKKSIEDNASNNNLLAKEKPTQQRLIKNSSQTPKSNSMKPTKLVETVTTVKSWASVSPQSRNSTTPSSSAKQKSTSASPQSEKPKLPSGAMATTPSPNTVKKAKEAGLIQCSMCQRCFASDRIQKHEEICSKTLNKKRKQYDALKHRVAGTEAETYVKGGKKTTRSQPVRNVPTSKPSNWRKKHEEFIMAIRAAKQVQAHISKGGKLSDLPPPPPSDTSDYIQCPHCKRKFNQSAAERHIPKCVNFQFNKPKPVAKKR